MKTLLLICIVSTFSIHCFSQGRGDSIRTKLEALADKMPGLKEKVDYSVDGTSLDELLKVLAKAHNLNVNVDASLTTPVSNNFSGVNVIDVLVFLCENYDMDIKFFGPIISFVPYKKPIDESLLHPQHPIKITYNDSAGTMSVDLKSDTLLPVMKKITELTKINFIYPQQLSSKLLTAYFQSAPLNDAIQNLALSNGLTITTTGNNFYTIDAVDNSGNSSFSSNPSSGRNQLAQINLPNGAYVKSVGNDLVDVSANSVPISDLIAKVATELKKHYYYLNVPKGNISLSIQSSTFEDFLNYIFDGTDFSYKADNNIFLIGDRSEEGLRETEAFQFQNRTVDKVMDLVPDGLKKNLDIKVFPDLNSLILTGSEPGIGELKSFLASIDKVVPVVQIEVIIVDVNKTNTITTGIQAGIGTPPTPTQGTILPGIDLHLNSSSVNEIIGAINGLGIVNLGKVAPTFYLDLKAMEEQGYLNVRSTPKLATLNGNEATLTIGSTQYYVEQTNNVIGTQNPQNIITQTYKPVSANLELKIKPIVSGDDQITLDIDMSQASFTNRISSTAPPGTISRDFKSLIRVKNEEMIVLGGLEENTTNNSSQGTPFLSRIPIIKWFFSSRTNSKSNDKLIVFIKPTVIQ